MYSTLYTTICCVNTQFGGLADPSNSGLILSLDGANCAVFDQRVSLRKCEKVEIGANDDDAV